jgi:hypothetical protein
MNYRETVCLRIGGKSVDRLWTGLLGAFIQVGVLSGVAPVFADEAQDYYATNVEALVQGKCIVCHRAGGQAASSGADLLFTSSVAANHAAFDDYVNTPSQGARANRVLSKITGALGHGGGRVIAPGSSDYAVFERYMELVSAEDEPAEPPPIVIPPNDTPPNASNRFNALLQTVQATRGIDSAQQTLTTSRSSPAQQRAQKEEPNVQARAAGPGGEPASIPAMPHYLTLMMSGLIGLFGLRRLRA